MRRRSASGRSWPAGHWWLATAVPVASKSSTTAEGRSTGRSVKNSAQPRSTSSSSSIPVGEPQAHADDLGRRAADAAAAAEAEPAPAASEQDARRLELRLGHARAGADPPRDPAVAGHALGPHDHRHREPSGAQVVGLEADDVDVAAEDPPLLQDLDGFELRRPRRTADRDPRRAYAARSTCRDCRLAATRGGSDSGDVIEHCLLGALRHPLHGAPARRARQNTRPGRRQRIRRCGPTALARHPRRRATSPRARRSTRRSAGRPARSPRTTSSSSRPAA